MGIDFFYVAMAILGLSFLIFIHELGHYIMARRVGMKVETFSIGFGRPILSWDRNGVKWQIGWLPFGGFVKIAGSEFDKDKDPYEIKDGFFGKPPLDRIKVALMGPLANLLFAVIAFAALWVLNGREKNFTEYTAKIGWIDPSSELYHKGIRPGDEISSYDNVPFESFKDHLFGPMTGSDTILVKGNKIDYSGPVLQKIPFEYRVNRYHHPAALDKGAFTVGVMMPASYVLYNRLTNGSENPLPVGSPLAESGISYGDRVYWANGEPIYSYYQLNHLLNSNKALLTVQRGNQTLLVRVPRVQAQELKANPEFREELIDWQFEAGLNNTKFASLYTIPYNITNNAVVQNPLTLIDKEKQIEIFPEKLSSELDSPLLPGDKIIAIYGVPVNQAYELLKEIQTYKMNVILQKDDQFKTISWRDADSQFDQQVATNDLQNIVSSIGTNHPVDQSGDLRLLKPLVPKTKDAFVLSPEKQAQVAAALQEQKKIIESIQDPEARTQALKQLHQIDHSLLLGLPGVQDRRVVYNPGPLALFNSVFGEIYRTFSALVSGTLNPKYLVGPIGIVHVVHNNSMTSLKEALYWLGAISLNLGVLNLLPIPVLDGGTIFMSGIEMVTRKKVPPKTLEKIVIPFAVLLIGFFIYLTYHDILRLFQ